MTGASIINQYTIERVPGGIGFRFGIALVSGYTRSRKTWTNLISTSKVLIVIISIHIKLFLHKGGLTGSHGVYLA